MNHLHRRSRYQYGSLSLEPRKRGPAVWVFRSLKTEGGKQTRPKTFVGTVDEYPTEADAQRACEHIRMAANAESARQPRHTMRGLTDRYVQEVLRPCLEVKLGEMQDEAAAMSFHCAKSYRSNINRYILPRWETYQLDEFKLPATRAAIEQWLKSLIRSAKNPTGLSGKTVGEILNTMKQVFKFAVKWGYLDLNPVTDKRVELPRGSRKRTKRSAQLSPAQFFLLLASMESCGRLAVGFAGWLGPRISEAFGLKWEDLDLVSGVVSFRRGFVEGRLTPLKTEASRTDLPLPDDVRELLMAWRRHTPFNAASDWVFASPHTKGKRPYWTGQMLKSHVQPTAIRLGLPKIGWHSFRHTVSAWAKEARLELNEFKTLLRHEDSGVALQIYGRIDLEAKRTAQQQMVDFVYERAKLEKKASQLTGEKRLLKAGAEFGA